MPNLRKKKERRKERKEKKIKKIIILYEDDLSGKTYAYTYLYL